MSITHLALERVADRHTSPPVERASVIIHRDAIRYAEPDWREGEWRGTKLHLDSGPSLIVTATLEELAALLFGEPA